LQLKLRNQELRSKKSKSIFLAKKVEMIVGVTFRHKVCQVQLFFATFNLFFDFPPDLFVGGCDAVAVVVDAVVVVVDGVAYSSTVSTYLCP